MLSVTINNYQIVGIIEKYKLIGHIFFFAILKNLQIPIFIYIYKKLYIKLYIYKYF